MKMKEEFESSAENEDDFEEEVDELELDDY